MWVLPYSSLFKNTGFNSLIISTKVYDDNDKHFLESTSNILFIISLLNEEEDLLCFANSLPIGEGDAIAILCGG